MKITDIRIRGFGAWRDLDFERLSHQMTVVYGPNEAGKTTLMQFVRSVLYGFAGPRSAQYLPPVHGGTAGGSLRLENLGGRYEVTRLLRPEGDPRRDQELQVVASDGLVGEQPLLDGILCGIDEPIFNNVFALGLHELQGLSLLDDTAAADQLYQLASGVDRVSLIDVVREVHGSRRHLFSHDPDESSRLAELIKRRETLHADMETAAVRHARWPKLNAQRRTLREEIEQYQRDIAGIRDEQRVLEVARAVATPWEMRRGIDRELAAIGELPNLPADSADRIDQLNLQRRKLRRRMAHQVKERGELRRQIRSMRVNDKLWRNAARIEALAEQIDWLGQLEEQQQKLQREVAEVEGLMAAQREQLGIATGKSDLNAFNSGSLTSLQAPARTMREQKKRIKAAREEEQTQEQRIAEIDEQLRGGLARVGAKDISKAMEVAGEQVELIRKRQQVEDRLDQLDRHRQEVESQCRHIIEDQIMPNGVVGWLGALFSLSGMLMLSAIFSFSKYLNFSSEVAFLFFFAGFLGIAGSVIVRMVQARAAEMRLLASKNQFAQLQRQREQVVEERNKLDRQLPSGGGPIVSRVDTAERQLAEVERLMPLEGKREQAKQLRAAARAQMKEATHQYREARAKWQATLKGMGLPDSLAPGQIREIRGNFDHCDELKRRLASRQEDLQQKRREMQSFVGRIHQLAADVGFVERKSEERGAANKELQRGREDRADRSEREERNEKAKGERQAAAARVLPFDHNLSPRQLLVQLKAAAVEQEALGKQRKDLVKQYKQLRRQNKQLGQKLAIVARRRRALFEAAGAADENHLRRLIAQLERRDQLVKERAETEREIAAAITGDVTLAQVEHQLALGDESFLAEQSVRCQHEMEDLERKIAVLHEQRAELLVELKTLAADRSPAEFQMELADVEQKITDAVRRWQVHGVLCRALDVVRKQYETERQPAVLQEASRYLQSLTLGAYERVWMPLDEQALRVDDNQGRTLPLEVLSRGTREQVYLSLRFSLCAAYARRGIQLPLILDDVLVNFDQERVLAAARLMHQFATAGHQILLFTCHEHIMRVFRAMHVDVRRLPRLSDGRYLPMPEEIPPALELPPAKKAEEIVPALHDESEFHIDDSPFEDWDGYLAGKYETTSAPPIVSEQWTFDPLAFMVEDAFEPSWEPWEFIEPAEAAAPVATMMETKLAAPPKPMHSEAPRKIVSPPRYEFEQRFTWDEPQILWELDHLDDEAA